MGMAPHPSPLVPARPVSLPVDPVASVWPCVASCGLPFLSLRCRTETETETGKQSSTAQERKQKRNRQRLKAGRNSGTLAAQERNGTYHRNTGRTANGRTNPQAERSRNRKGRYTPFPFFPSFPHSPFSFLSRSRTHELKLFFGLYAIVRPLFTKLGKINL